MLIHASHGSSDENWTIIIKFPYSDMDLLAFASNHSISASILYCTGTKMWQRRIHPTATSKLHKEDACSALLRVHVFTGCDSTSVFAGKGNKLGFQLNRSAPNMCSAMKMLSTSFDVDHELIESCSLYGHSGDITNAVNYKLFCSKNAVPANYQEQQMPWHTRSQKPITKHIYGDILRELAQY